MENLAVGHYRNYLVMKFLNPRNILLTWFAIVFTSLYVDLPIGVELVAPVLALVVASTLVLLCRCPGCGESYGVFLSSYDFRSNRCTTCSGKADTGE